MCVPPDPVVEPLIHLCILVHWMGEDILERDTMGLGSARTKLKRGPSYDRVYRPAACSTQTCSTAVRPGGDAREKWLGDTILPSFMCHVVLASLPQLRQNGGFLGIGVCIQSGWRFQIRSKVSCPAVYCCSSVLPRCTAVFCHVLSFLAASLLQGCLVKCSYSCSTVCSPPAKMQRIPQHHRFL